ncbi:MAG TPA: hypothetical protein VIK97_05490, partial [Casimicrobiaceae bacterium]
TNTDAVVDGGFGIELVHLRNRLELRFDESAVPRFVPEERVAIRGNAGPGSSRLLATDIANCLNSGLLFALRKLSLP